MTPSIFRMGILSAALLVLLCALPIPGSCQSSDPHVIESQTAPFLRSGIDYGGPIYVPSLTNLSATPTSDVPPGVLIEVPRSQVPPQKGWTTPPATTIQIGAPTATLQIPQSQPTTLLEKLFRFILPQKADAQAVGAGTGFSGRTPATGIVPADAAGAVGPNNVVSALNGEYWFLSRTGSGQGETGNSFWCTNSNFLVNGCPGTLANPGTSHLLNFDGKIFYDAQAGRWVVTSSWGNGDPVELRHSHAIRLPGHFKDLRSYRRLGPLLVSGMWQLHQQHRLCR